MKINWFKVNPNLLIERIISLIKFANNFIYFISFNTYLRQGSICTDCNKDYIICTCNDYNFSNLTEKNILDYIFKWSNYNLYFDIIAHINSELRVARNNCVNQISECEKGDYFALFRKEMLEKRKIKDEDIIKRIEYWLRLNYENKLV